MTRIAWRMLAHRPVRLLATWAGLGFLFFLAAAQVGLLVGWCNTCSAIIRHADADVWVLAEGTSALDYGSGIPEQRLYLARGVPGVARADPMIMTWSTWQRPDGRRLNVALVGLDATGNGGPWVMRDGDRDRVHLPDGVIIDELYLKLLGVTGTGDEVEMYGRKAVIRGVSREIRTLTASPHVFASMDGARRYDPRYAADEITYVLVRSASGHTPEAVRDRLRAELPHVEVLTAREFAVRTMRYWMLGTGLGITVVLTAVLGLAVGAVVTSQTLFTVTQEHIRDYATLSAVGFGRGRLLGCVVVQGLVLATGGVLIGSALFAVASTVSARTAIPLDMLPVVYAGLVGASVASSLGGAVVSLRLVSRVDPASVFRG